MANRCSGSMEVFTPRMFEIVPTLIEDDEQLVNWLESSVGGGAKLSGTSAERVALLQEHLAALDPVKAPSREAPQRPAVALGMCVLWEDREDAGPVFGGIYLSTVRESCCYLSQKVSYAMQEVLHSSHIIKVSCGFTATIVRKLMHFGYPLASIIDIADVDRRSNREAAKRNLDSLAREQFNLQMGFEQDIRYKGQEGINEEASAVAHMCALLYSNLFKHCMVKRAALPCPNLDCDRYFASQKSLDHHRHVHHNDPALPNSHPFKCSQCPKYFRSETALVQHAEVSHESSPVQETTHTECDCGTGGFLCPGCGKRFLSRSALKMHADVAHTPSARAEVHRCPVCTKEFHTPDALCQHQQCLGHLLSNVCVVCFASFHDDSQLESHYKDTNHNQYWLCAECPKKFPEHEALLKHEASTNHTGGFQARNAPEDYPRKKPTDKAVLEASVRSPVKVNGNPTPKSKWAQTGAGICNWGDGAQTAYPDLHTAMFTPLKSEPPTYAMDMSDTPPPYSMAQTPQQEQIYYGYHQLQTPHHHGSQIHHAQTQHNNVQSSHHHNGSHALHSIPYHTPQGQHHVGSYESQHPAPYTRSFQYWQCPPVQYNYYPQTPQSPPLSSPFHTGSPPHLQNDSPIVMRVSNVTRVHQPYGYAQTIQA